MKADPQRKVEVNDGHDSKPAISGPRQVRAFRLFPLRAWAGRMFLVFPLVLAFPVRAAERALLEVTLPPTNAVWAGQRVTFAVTLLVQGQFAGSPNFDAAAVAGAILLKPAERPLLGTREAHGETYTSQRHEFVLFPQRAGPCSVPPIQVRFASRERYGDPMVEHQLRTAAFEVEARVPPGARRGEVLVSTTELEATESWTPKPVAAKVGDAFSRTIAVKANGVPGMLLPMLEPRRIAGLGVYPKPDQGSDRTERGEFTGERISSVTYVCEQAGTFEFPAVAIRWWNPDLQSWAEKQFPSVTLEVADNRELLASVTAAGGPVTVASRNWRAWLGGFGLLAVAACVAGPRIVRHWERRKNARAEGEPARFKRLVKACRAGDAVAAYRELSAWLAHFDRRTCELNSIQPGNDRLRLELMAMQRRVAGMASVWEGRGLAEVLPSLRRDCLARGGVESRPPLGPLNPDRDDLPGRRSYWTKAQ
jgi:hypothetical protein